MTPTKNLKRSEYGELRDAKSAAEWNPAHRAYYGRDDYRTRITMSGLWIAVVLKWHPGLVASYAGAPMTDLEIVSMEAIGSTSAFGRWWSSLLDARDGSAPSDLVERVVTGNQLRDVVDRYAQPTE